MILYVVQCTFAESVNLVRDKWLDWLKNGHIDDVIAGGAKSAEIFRLDGDLDTYQIHYRFESRVDFDNYETKHAPRLRDEGLTKFPLNLGLSYQRFVGESI